MDIQQCFDILKLDPNASIDGAKRAHRDLAFIWHPDRHSDKLPILQKRAEREMQKINEAYETVLSFLSSEQEKAQQAEVQARAKAAADARAREAQANVKAAPETRALHRKIGIPKVIVAVSIFVICSLLVIGYTMRSQTRPPVKYPADSRVNPNDAKVNHNQVKGQEGKIASSAPTSSLAKEAVAVPEVPESSKPEAGTDVSQQEHIAEAVAVPEVPESSKPEAGTGVVEEERLAGAVAVPEEPESSKLEAGRNALEERRFAEAIALFKEILANDPSMMNKVSGAYARALQGQASELVKTDPPKAKELLLTSVELEPGSAQGHFRLGLLYVREKDYPNAIDTYQKAAELDPQFPETFFNLGYIYAIIKDYSKAKEMYGRVVELVPSFLDEALFNLAIVQEKLGERDMSIKNLEQAITVNPKNRLAKRYLQRLNLKSGGDQ